MAAVLKALGITVENKKDYNTQFGVKLNKREIQEIVKPAERNLLAKDQTTIIANRVLNVLEVQIQDLFDTPKGEVDMIFIDLPNGYTPPEPIIVLSDTVRSKAKVVYSTIGVCHLAEKVGETELEFRNDTLSVFEAAWEGVARKDPFYVPNGSRSEHEFTQKKLQELGKFNYYELNIYDSPVKILEQPKHGQITQDLSNNKSFFYRPNLNYVGNDKAVFLVSMDGHDIKVVYYFKTPNIVDSNRDVEKLWSKYCPAPRTWKISSNLPTGTDNFTQWQTTANLNAMLANASYSLA